MLRKCASHCSVVTVGADCLFNEIWKVSSGQGAGDQAGRRAPRGYRRPANKPWRGRGCRHATQVPGGATRPRLPHLGDIGEGGQERGDAADVRCEFKHQAVRRYGSWVHDLTCRTARLCGRWDARATLRRSAASPDLRSLFLRLPPRSLGRARPRAVKNCQRQRCGRPRADALPKYTIGA